MTDGPGGVNGRLEAHRHRATRSGQAASALPLSFPRGSAEKIEALPQPHDDGPSPLLDLGDPAVRRMIKLAKKRGYVTYDELNGLMASDRFSAEQIKGVLDQLVDMGITVVAAEETQERAQPRATAERKEAPGRQPEAPTINSNLVQASWAVYGNVFEGYWDGTRWLSAGGVPCKPTHRMPLP